MNADPKQQDSALFLLIALLVFVFFILPIWYAAQAALVNGVLLALAKGQLKCFLHFSEEARKVWVHLASLDPATLSWTQMQTILHYTGTWIRWPMVAFLGGLGIVSLYMERRLSRRLNMKKLLVHNVESFPCLRPIVGRGKALLSFRSYDSGAWKIAQSPLQFAVEHGLLLDDKGIAFAAKQVLRRGLGHAELDAYGQAFFDAEKALQVLKVQLGAPFSGFTSLSPVRQAVASALASYAAGDKNTCLNLLDTVSLAYSEKWGCRPASAVLTQSKFQQRVAMVWQDQAHIHTTPRLLRHGAFELTWFMALLTQARQKGVLATSQFLWLRPLDRPLWYTLNQCGGRTAWAEAFAPWAHYIAEEKAGKALNTPHVANAVQSLKEALSDQGWLQDTPVRHSYDASDDFDLFAEQF